MTAAAPDAMPGLAVPSLGRHAPWVLSALAHGVLVALLLDVAARPPALPPREAAQALSISLAEALPRPEPVPAAPPPPTKPAAPRRPAAPVLPTPAAVAPEVPAASPAQAAPAEEAFAAPAPALPEAPAAEAAPAAAPLPVSAPVFDADYLRNPKPAYPVSARRRGQGGTATLAVRVSAEGRADEVTLRRSSGVAALDQAALEAVARWRFRPARRGAEAVAALVLVPITFELEEEQ